MAPVVVCVLALAGGYANGSDRFRSLRPPHIAALQDHHMFWALRRGEKRWYGGRLPLYIYLADTKTLKYQRFGFGGDGDLYSWQLHGDWLWCLMHDGLWRIKRFPPKVGKAERFEPKMINHRTGHRLCGFKVLDSRILMAGDEGLLLYDRHTRQVTKIGPMVYGIFRNTPFGIVVQNPEGFFLLKTTAPDLRLTRLPTEPSNSLRSGLEAPAYVFTEVGRFRREPNRLYFLTDSSTLLWVPAEKLRLDLRANETLVGGILWQERIWVVTGRRLVALESNGSVSKKYNFRTEPGEEFAVQDGILRYGPLMVEERDGGFVVSEIVLSLRSRRPVFLRELRPIEN